MPCKSKSTQPLRCQDLLEHDDEIPDPLGDFVHIPTPTLQFRPQDFVTVDNYNKFISSLQEDHPAREIDFEVLHQYILSKDWSGYSNNIYQTPNMANKGHHELISEEIVTITHMSELLNTELSINDFLDSENSNSSSSSSDNSETETDESDSDDDELYAEFFQKSKNNHIIFPNPQQRQQPPSQFVPSSPVALSTMSYCKSIGDIDPSKILSTPTSAFSDFDVLSEDTILSPSAPTTVLNSPISGISEFEIISHPQARVFPQYSLEDIPNPNNSTFDVDCHRQQRFSDLNLNVPQLHTDASTDKSHLSLGTDSNPNHRKNFLKTTQPPDSHLSSHNVLSIAPTFPMVLLSPTTTAVQKHSHVPQSPYTLLSLDNVKKIIKVELKKQLMIELSGDNSQPESETVDWTMIMVEQSKLIKTKTVMVDGVVRKRVTTCHCKLAIVFCLIDIFFIFLGAFALADRAKSNVHIIKSIINIVDSHIPELRAIFSLGKQGRSVAVILTKLFLYSLGQGILSDILQSILQGFDLFDWIIFGLWVGLAVSVEFLTGPAAVIAEIAILSCTVIGLAVDVEFTIQECIGARQQRLLRKKHELLFKRHIERLTAAEQQQVDYNTIVVREQDNNSPLAPQEGVNPLAQIIFEENTIDRLKTFQNELQTQHSDDIEHDAVDILLNFVVDGDGQVVDQVKEHLECQNVVQ